MSDRRANPDLIVLPSGEEFNIDRPNFMQLRSEEDFLEVQCALQEKIIDIELQIEIACIGQHPPVGKADDLSWLPRANAALKWAKLYRAECQERRGMVAKKEKAARQLTHDSSFVGAARAMLDHETFMKISAVATTMTKTEPTP